jgi:hypothetical protein
MNRHPVLGGDDRVLETPGPLGGIAADGNLRLARVVDGDDPRPILPRRNSTIAFLPASSTLSPPRAGVP